MPIDWSTHTWNKGSQKRNYVDQYRKNLWTDLQAADTDGDKTLSTSEFGKIWDKMYDIKGDGRAPHSGGWFDKGAGVQNMLAKLITRQGLKADTSLLNRFGLVQDQETGDILAGVGFKHRESNFGRDADDSLSSYEGLKGKDFFADSHWSFSDYGNEIPTFRYKWSNTDAFKPTTSTGDVADDSSFKKEVELDPLTQTPKSQKYTGFVPSDALIEITAQNQGGWDKLADTTNLFEYGYKDDGTKFTNNEFITKAYQDIYSRNPDAASLSHWNEKFAVGVDGKTGTTYKDMLMEMRDSDEGRLNRLYKNIFDRPLGKEGKEYWLDGDMKTLMAEGKTRDEAWSAIKSNIMNMGQDEYKNKWDGYDPWNSFQNQGSGSSTSNTNTVSTNQSTASDNTNQSNTSTTSTDVSTYDPYYGLGKDAYEALDPIQQVNAEVAFNRKKNEDTIAKQGITNRQSIMEMGELGKWTIDRLPDDVGTTTSVEDLLKKYTDTIKTA